MVSIRCSAGTYLKHACVYNCVTLYLYNMYTSKTWTNKIILAMKNLHYAFHSHSSSQNLSVDSKQINSVYFHHSIHISLHSDFKLPVDNGNSLNIHCKFRFTIMTYLIISISKSIDQFVTDISFLSNWTSVNSRHNLKKKLFESNQSLFKIAA